MKIYNKFRKSIIWIIILSVFFTTTFAYAQDSVMLSEAAAETETVMEPYSEEIPEAATPEGFSAVSSSDGILITWIEVPNANGYYISRKTSDDDTWTNIATISSDKATVYNDTSIAQGVEYHYTIQAYTDEAISEHSPEQIVMYLATPEICNWKRLSSKKMKLTWSKLKNVSGYKIEYSTSPKFKNPSRITAASNISQKEISVSKANTKYYIRICSYKNSSSGTTYYSDWHTYSGVKSNIKFSPKIIKKNNKTFELISQSNQKLYQYDVLQGSCTDNTYGYYVLLNKNNNKSKIVKIKLSNMKVIKVSKPLQLSHGNDMTYNSDTKKLVVAHGVDKPKRLSIVNPKTLTLEKHVDVKIPSGLKGATSKQLRAVKGFVGVAYNNVRDQYIVYLSGSHNFIILDKNFKPVSYIVPSKKHPTLYQGMDATNDYVLVAQSPKAGTGQTYNVISVYDWDGEYLFNITVKKGYEIESIYHVGNTYYAGFYRSYTKKAYKYKYKNVKVKWKKVNGKWKYKYKRKKVKVAYNKFCRANYIYKIGTL